MLSLQRSCITLESEERLLQSVEMFLEIWRILIIREVLSNRVAESAFHMAENDDADEEDDEADGCAGDQLIDLDGAGSEKGEAEAFNHGYHGVEHEQPVPFLGIE